MHEINFFWLIWWIFEFITYHAGDLWNPKKSQLDQKSVLFTNDTLCLITNPQTNTKNWAKRMKRTYHKIFDQFLDETLTLERGGACVGS